MPSRLLYCLNAMGDQKPKQVTKKKDEEKEKEKEKRRGNAKKYEDEQKALRRKSGDAGQCTIAKRGYYFHYCVYRK